MHGGIQVMSLIHSGRQLNTPRMTGRIIRKASNASLFIILTTHYIFPPKSRTRAKVFCAPIDELIDGRAVSATRTESASFQGKVTHYVWIAVKDIK